jgi:cobalt-zinc-cadmium resistance protein CzcA
MRLRAQDRAGIEDLGRLPIALPGGHDVRLDQVAHVSLIRGPSAIRRDNGERRVQVDANLARTDLASAVNALRARLPELKLPPGYRVRFTGSYEEQRRVQRSINIAIVAALLVIFIILEAAFGSSKQAALMILTIPLALSGGVVALWLTGISFNVSSLIGLLALFGLAIQKAVLLIQHANDSLARGLTPEESARAAAIVRFRPVFLTTAAAALAVLPLAVGLGAGAQLQQPMAVVIVGGVTSDMLLALGLLPALFRFTVKRKRKA